MLVSSSILLFSKNKTFVASPPLHRPFHSCPRCRRIEYNRLLIASIAIAFVTTPTSHGAIKVVHHDPLAYHHCYDPLYPTSTQNAYCNHSAPHNYPPSSLCNHSLHQLHHLRQLLSTFQSLPSIYLTLSFSPKFFTPSVFSALFGAPQ